MIRSLAFTTQGRLHSKNIEMFLMPTLLSDTNLFLWIDLEKPTPEETKFILEDVFHFHPLSIEDCVGVSPSPKVEEYLPKEEDKFAPYLFMVIHAVDYSRENGLFATKELDFFLGKNFLVTWHEKPMKAIAPACCSGVFGVPALNQWLLTRIAGGVTAMLMSGAWCRALPRPASVAPLAQRLRQAGDLGALFGRAGRKEVVERLAVAAGQQEATQRERGKRHHSFSALHGICLPLSGSFHSRSPMAAPVGSAIRATLPSKSSGLGSISALPPRRGWSSPSSQACRWS